MHPWFGQLTAEQAEQLAAQQEAQPRSHAKTGVGSKGEMDAKTMRRLHEISTRSRTPSEDPPVSIPEYVPTDEKLEALHHRALFFIDQLEQNHLIESVGVESPFVWFLGHRVYFVPSPGSTPNFMLEVWWKGDEEWEKSGVFANAYRAFEHIYMRVMRARISQLVRSSK